VLVQAGILKKERVGQLRVCSLDCERLREALTMGGAWALTQITPDQKPARAKRRAADKGVKRATRTPKAPRSSTTT
jgi:hypothetical protein